MFDTQGKLDIFDDFKLDRSLPKFKRPVEANAVFATSSGANNIFTVVNNSSFGMMTKSESSGDWERRSWWKRLVDWWRAGGRAPDQLPIHHLPITLQPVHQSLFSRPQYVQSGFVGEVDVFRRCGKLGAADERL